MERRCRRGLCALLLLVFWTTGQVLLRAVHLRWHVSARQTCPASQTAFPDGVCPLDDQTALAPGPVPSLPALLPAAPLPDGASWVSVAAARRSSRPDAFLRAPPASRHV